MRHLSTVLTILQFGALVATTNCGDLVRPNDVGVLDGQGQVDVVFTEDTLLDRPNFDRPTVIVDAASDGADAEVATWDVPVVDVVQLPSACDGGQCTPPDAMPLANTNQSCRGPNGAPAEHCREVWASGGPFVMGSRTAMKLPYRGVWRPQEACDVVPGVVHPGYVDAYPASVARFRAYMRAGRPRPPVGTIIFDGYVWDASVDRYVAGALIPTAQNLPYCSYNSSLGVNDDLPMNCLTIPQMMAFCYWDGKHYPTEPMWEFVATNGGTTTRPFVPPAEWSLCDWGDVSHRGCRPGTSELPLPITSFPQSQTFSPAGIFGLWGGPSTYLIRSRVTCGENFVDGWVRDQPMVDRSMLLRGTSNLYDLSEADVFRMGQSRSYVENADFSEGDMGIRCMRWVPESRE